jgi:hypothetical protein
MMNTKAELTKIWKDVQDSAKEFAHYSLQTTSKVLDVAAKHLGDLTADLKARAEKLAPETDAPKAEEPPKSDAPPTA